MASGHAQDTITNLVPEESPPSIDAGAPTASSPELTIDAAVPVQDGSTAPDDTAASGVIYHSLPEDVSSGAPLSLEAFVETVAVPVAGMLIYHRLSGQSTYKELGMTEASPGLYSGTIAVADLLGNQLEYYLVAVLADESVVTFPASNPAGRPLSVPIQIVPETVSGSADIFGGSSFAQSDLLILSPEPNEAFRPDEVLVAISLFNLPNLDLSSIRLFIDGIDVSASADLTAEFVSYAPPEMSSGQHEVEFRATTLSGAPYPPVSWPFRVVSYARSSVAGNFRHSGSVTSNYQHTNIDGEVLDITSVQVAYQGGWDWLTYRSRVKLTSDEDPYKSPRNRFFLAFETPVFNLGLGDVTPRLNRFTLDGKRVRGFDADLRLMGVNLRVVRGELERGIQGRPGSAYTVEEYQSFDSGFAADTLRLSRSGYSFKRNVLAVRPSFGSANSFEWAFSYLKAKDVISSVESDVAGGLVSITDSTFGARYFSQVEFDSTANARIVSFQDIVDQANANSNFEYVLPADDWVGKFPQDNLVIGSDLSLLLDNRRFSVQSGFALSMLNKNIWDPVLSLEELDTFAPGDTVEDGMVLGEIDIGNRFDPADFEEFFHININQIPLVPIAIDSASWANPLQLIAKMPSLAYYATGKFNYLSNLITLEYQQVGPDYNSLANPNIQKNVRIRSISDRIRMFNNRLFLTALYRATDDDIVKLEGDNITTTTNLNLSASLNLGLGLPGVSFGTRTYNRDNGIAVLDTIENKLISGTDTTIYNSFIDRRSSTQTKSTNLGLTYRLQMLTIRHDLSLNVANTEISDQILDRHRSPADTLYTTPTSPAASSSILSLGVNSILSDRLRTNVSLSTNSSKFGAGETLVAQDLLSLAFTARYTLMDGKMNVRGGFNFTGSNSDKSGAASVRPPNFTRLGIKGGVDIRLLENLQWVTNIEFRTKTVIAEDFEESVGSSIITSNLQYRF